ncbi:MAG: polysaccharide pyruvyl transferase family protein [Pirellulales bacterium]
MRYLIDGCYGDGNVGDECLLLALAQLVRRTDSAAQIVAMSSTPAETTAETGLAAIAQCNPLGSNLYGSIAKGLLAETVRQIQAADVFLLGGGELFRDQPGYRAAFGMFYRLRIARRLGKRVLAVGVGAQAATRWWGTRVLRGAARACDRIVCRDSESLELIRDWRESAADSLAAPDLVFSLDWRQIREQAAALRAAEAADSVRSPVLADAPTIGFAVKSLPRGHARGREVNEQLMPTVIETLAHVSQTQHCRLQVLPFAADDAALAAQVEERLRAAGGVLRPAPAARIEPLRRAVSRLDALVALPLHASIFAFSCGVPALGLAYDRKVQRLYDSFGVSRFCRDAAAWNRAALAQSLSELWPQRRALGVELAASADRAAARIQGSFTHLTSSA